MEKILHYIWQYKLYDNTSLHTTDGLEIEVLDPGAANRDAGPDFFNAKIKTGTVVWVGNVEIHDHASDWLKHHHDTDKLYDTVILHVTGEDDAVIRRSNGEIIPQLVLTIPEKVRANIDWLLYRNTPISCLPALPLYLDSLSLWMDGLLSERLERKTQDIQKRLQMTEGDWDETFYITLARSFGFGSNSDAFEWLAWNLPLKYLLKHRNSSSQVEAMIFGQAGMLNESDGDDYYLLLQREYRYLRNKYKLTGREVGGFRNLRMRPGCFPHIRIAQFAALCIEHDRLFSEIKEEQNIEKLKALLCSQPSEYWKVHYHFNVKSLNKEKQMGSGGLNSILINAVVPTLFAYGRTHGEEEYCRRAVALLESLPGEKNFITDYFRNAGVEIKNAGCSQALIQLMRCYCERHSCLQCRIGHQILRHGIKKSE